MRLEDILCRGMDFVPCHERIRSSTITWRVSSELALGAAFGEKQDLWVWLGRSVKRCFSSVNRGERHDAAVAVDEAIGRCAPAGPRS
jgi:hypothetical protein